MSESISIVFPMYNEAATIKVVGLGANNAECQIVRAIGRSGQTEFPVLDTDRSLVGMITYDDLRTVEGADGARSDADSRDAPEEVGDLDDVAHASPSSSPRRYLSAVSFAGVVKNSSAG